MTHEFELISQIFKHSYVQTFDDEKKGRALITCQPMAISTYEDLQNLNHQGAGIFFTPNPCEGGRKEEQIVAIHWAFADLDYESKEEQLARIKQAPLIPSLIIESKKSFHVYYRADIALGNWERIIQGLIQYFDSDPAISSPNEVLRFPGFNHMKNAKEPFLVTIHTINEFVYTEDHLMKAFPYVSPSRQFEKKFGTGLESVKSIPIHNVLGKLGIDVRRNQIFEDGQGTSMMINVKENYVNRFSGKAGSGSVIDLVMLYKQLTAGQAIAWLKKEYRLEETLTYLDYGQLLAEAAHEIRETRAERLCTYHIPWLNQELGAIFKREVVIIGAETGIGKSEFAIQLASHNVRHGKRVLFFELEMSPTDVAHRNIIRKMNQQLGEEWIQPKYYYMNQMTSRQRTVFEEILSGSHEHHERFQTYNGSPLNFEAFLKAFEKDAPHYDLVIVDHLHYFSLEQEQQSQELGRIMREIRNLTKRTGVPVVLVSHVTKIQKREEIDLKHLYGSSNIAKEATTVILMSRDIEENFTTIALRKCRTEGQGKTKLFTFDPVSRTLIACDNF